MDYKIKKINGVDVLFTDMPDSNSVTVLVLAKAGSIYEQRDTNGISHFLEHMFFKGGIKYPNPQIVAETIDEIGGEFNAFTSEEYAGYYVKSSPDHVSRAVDVLSDMLVNAQFPSAELEREKGVIIQELMMYEDMPHRLVVDKFKEFYYGDNNFGRQIIGTQDNIKSFTQDNFFTHKNALYTKDNLLVVVAGKIKDASSLEQQIGESFKDLPATRTYALPVLPDYRPASHEAFFDKKTQQNHLVIGAQGFNMFDDHRLAANVLGIILGGNMSSRLFQEIREKRGLCYYISAFHSPNFYDGLFYIRAGIEKDRFDYGLQSIYEQIEDIANGNFTQADFDKAIGYIIGNTQISLETSDQIADFVGHQYLFQTQVESLEEILDKYRALKLEDVKAVASKLKRENLYLYYIC